MTTRRGFCRDLLALTGGVVLLSTFSTRSRGGGGAVGVRARPGAKGLDPDRYRLVGREYLRAAPEEADSGRLAALLGLPGSPAVRPDARAVARWLDVDRRRIAGEIREDFAAGRVACLRGWRVSETEARICALVTLVCESAV